MDEPDDNISDERDQITKIMKKKIIEDEETEKMKFLIPLQKQQKKQ